MAVIRVGWRIDANGSRLRSDSLIFFDYSVILPAQYQYAICRRVLDVSGRSISMLKYRLSSALVKCNKEGVLYISTRWRGSLNRATILPALFLIECSPNACLSCHLLGSATIESMVYRTRFQFSAVPIRVSLDFQCVISCITLVITWLETANIMSDYTANCTYNKGHHSTQKIAFLFLYTTLRQSVLVPKYLCALVL